jgi:hypothetical protein
MALAAVLMLSLAPTAAQSNSFLSNLLRREEFSAADIRAVERGDAVVKALDTEVRQELAYFGVVHVDAPADRFVERFADIETFERGRGVPQIGRFGVSPRLADLASVTLPAKDVAALERCRPGDCDVKLPTATITRLRNQVNWSSPDAASQANEITREMLLELVHAYETNGNAALGLIDDGGEPRPVAEQFRALLRNSTHLPLLVPGLVTYLDEYPRSRPPGVDEFFYWSVVDFGLKPTVRLNHVIIYPLAARPSGVSHVIAIKQLYASHYFHTALELRFLVDDLRRPDRRGFYLFSITRSRIDGTSGFAGGLLRSVINRRSRTAVRSYLEHLKRQVETADPPPV